MRHCRSVSLRPTSFRGKSQSPLPTVRAERDVSLCDARYSSSLGVAFESGLFQRCPAELRSEETKIDRQHIHGAGSFMGRGGKEIAARLFQNRLRMVGEMNRSGIKLLAGTDMGFDGYPVAGFA